MSKWESGIDSQRNSFSLFSVMSVNLTLVLYKAIQCGNVEDADRAIRDGADVNGTCYGGTPLYVAIQKREFESSSKIIKLLINNGANVNVQPNGLSVLHEAARCGNLFAVKLIVTKITDINVRDVNNHTALHEAIIYTPALVERHENDICSYYYEVIEYLIESGADVNAAALDTGTLPLSSTITKQCNRLLELLIKNGANVNIPKSVANVKWYSIDIAIWGCYTDGVKMLIEAGADVTHVNTGFTTPISIVNMIEGNKGSWTPKKHLYRPKKIKEAIKTTIILAITKKCSLNCIPRDILLVICGFVAAQ